MATKKPATFKPEAIDADGDGIVQEGTEFERPVDFEAQVTLSEPTSEAIEAALERAEIAIRANTAPKVYAAQEGDSYAAIADKFPKPGMTKHDRSSELYALNGGKKLNPGTEVKL